MRRGLGALLVAVALGLGVAALLLVPSRVHVPRSRLPQVVGQTRLEFSPAQTLDCGSVFRHGPQWSSEGGPCEGALSGRHTEALAVGLLALLAIAWAVARLFWPQRAVSGQELGRT